jgi:hypothetical protein
MISDSHMALLKLGAYVVGFGVFVWALVSVYYRYKRMKWESSLIKIEAAPATEAEKSIGVKEAKKAVEDERFFQQVCREANEQTKQLLRGTTDAWVWAREFVRINGGDETVMFGWFADAISAGVNHSHRNSLEYKAQVEECNKKSEDPTATILMTYEKALEQVEKETAAPEKSKTKRKTTKKKASNSK